MSTTPIHTPQDRVRAPSRPLALSLPFDAPLLLATIGLCACSLLMLDRTTARDVPGSPDFYLDRQSLYVGLGVILMVLAARVDYSRLRELRYGLYGALLASILAVALLGQTTRGSRLSIDVGPFSFQSSEFGKVLLMVVLAAFLVERARALQDRDTTARAMLLALVPTGLVLSTDLGSALVYVAVALAMLFVAGIPWRHFAFLGALGAVAISVSLVALPAAGVDVLKPYQKDRLTSFLSPSEKASKEAYQQNQSRIAIGSGEKTGRGDAATQTQYDFLPEHHTDFPFATIGERWGFSGAALVLSLYALLVWRGLRILTQAKNLYGALIAAGVVAMILFQVFINVGMNLGIMPITGIPLPLVSYGGSSVLTTFLAIGLLQSIYAQGRAAAATKGRVLGF